MSINIGYDYFLPAPLGQPGPLPQYGKQLSYSVQRNALAAGYTGPAPVPPFQYDFSTGLFSQTPVVKTAPLPAGSPAQFYTSSIISTPQAQWYDGEYAVSFFDVTVPTATVFLRKTYAEMKRGDDGWNGLTPSVVATYSDRILKDIRQYLIDIGMFNQQQCVFSIRETNFPLPGSPFLVLRPMGWNQNEPLTRGGGRYTYGMRHTLRARLMDQRLVDIGQQDYYRLVDLRYALLLAVNNLHNALQMYFPIDAAGNVLTVEPVRLLNESRPARDQQDPEQWAFIDSFIEINYYLAMNP